MGDAEETKETEKTFIAPAIKTFDHYDFTRAKICCSLTWLVAKAFGTDSVPEELKDPFYTDQYEQEHVKPPVVALLQSAELYCRAGSLILKSDAAKPLLGHDAVIRALAQRGLYVTDAERLVSERDLQSRPVQMSAHLAMTDTLMMAYAVEMVSAEKLASCLRKYSPSCPHVEVPYDTEEAVVGWINKVNEHLKDIIVQEQKVREVPGEESSGSPQAGYRRNQTLPRPVPCIPLMDNLLKDSSDGCAIAALIHFYCPDTVRLEDICLKENMSLADSLYNLQLIQDFCQENLNQCCHFTLEDMLYATSSIKNNYLVFMAELFWWFEVVKPSFVRPRQIQTEEPAPPVGSTPQAAVSNSTKRNFVENLPSPEQQPSIPLGVQPRTAPASGVIKRSTSMSYVDGCVGTWPKEKRSSARGISFDIPFDKENTLQTPSACGRGMTRSVSTDGVGFRVNHVARNMKRNLSFQPVNGQSGPDGIEEEECFSESLSGDGVVRRRGKLFPRGQPGMSNGAVRADPGSPPSIEEALKIIHDSERPHGGLRSRGVNNGFFLHGLDREDSRPVSRRADEEDPDSASTEVDTGIHVRTEDFQETLEEDSSLRDYTVSTDSDVDHDFDLKVCLAREATSPCPSSTSSNSGVRMTSFAEQKFRKLSHFDGRGSGGSSLKTTPESSELNLPHTVSWARTPEEIPVRQSPGDPTQMLASEMVHLKMKLEEKRRAIEAQKKKVQDAFTRHRQRMGRTAFLDVVRKKGGATSPLREELAGSKSDKPSTGPRIIWADTKDSTGDASSLRPGRCKPEAMTEDDRTKSPNEESPGEVDLGEYTRSIEKLNTSLGLLQAEMQRLAQQQEVIMQMREQQSWVIPPPQPSPQKQVRELRHAPRSVGSLSPVLSAGGSPRAPHRSPNTAIRRKSASFHARTPRTPRPSELKVAPFSRMLNTPQSVDSLPHLRRFSASQTQTSSLACLGHDAEPKAQLSPPAAAGEQGWMTPRSPTKDTPQGGRSAQEERTVEVKPTEAKVSEVLSQPVTETFTVTLTENPAYPTGQTAGSLIEVPLSILKPLDGPTQEKVGEGGECREIQDEDQKTCCGFFFKDDMQGEEDIALKRAALLEKRLRREKEAQRKRLQQEAELEQKKEAARLKAEEEKQKKEDEKARREYIKQEYLRRKQLKLMDDMDAVIKPRPLTNKQKKPRPKSIHRDTLESPKAPAKAAAGSRPRVFSVSSLSLASLTLGDSESVHSESTVPRPDSADGCLFPCRLGEKDWENSSTTSSVASNTEYTGPKLYKEPSAKSNKHIIHNALSHCCLAGRVNEGQKNRILEEMEKSEANNFLILFRDSGCQFRSLYTYCPETEEITKLTGIGPKTITRKMIEGLYKYNSDRKQFSHIPAKTMSASVDAITIFGHLWQTKKPGTPKKGQLTKSS